MAEGQGDVYRRLDAREQGSLANAYEREKRVSLFDHVWERLTFTERLLASGMTPTAITHALTVKFSISRHEANNYQAAVRRRWQREAFHESREQVRLRLQRMIEQNIADASARDLTVCTGKDKESGERIYKTVRAPDYKAINMGVALLMRLFGLDAHEQLRDLEVANDNAQPLNARGTRPTLVVSTDAISAELVSRRKDEET